MTATDTDILEQAEDTVGKVLRGKWHLDGVLGVGGMAAVFAATHRNGKRAAIKVLHREAALAPTVKDRFLREGYLANRVGHPGAVSILDDDIDEDGTVYLVMELLQGETLEARLDRSRDLAGTELLQIVHQVLDCLAAAHDKGIVHRDLKPGNLFVTEQGRVKILDFGIARIGVGERGKHATGAQTLGTPGFMPPEQARGRWAEVDAQSDLWAMGAVMFAVLTGRYVHEAPTVNEQLLSAMTEPARPVRELNDAVPEELAELVDRALAFDKSDRWPDASTMRTAVRRVYETLAGESMERAPTLSVRPPPAPSIDPAAATLDAADLPKSPRPETTARPVTGQTDESGSKGLRLAGAALAALVALGGITFALGADSGDATEKVPREPTDFSGAAAVPRSDEPHRPWAGSKESSPPSNLDEGIDGGLDGGDEDAGEALPEPPLNPPRPDPVPRRPTRPRAATPRKPRSASAPAPDPSRATEQPAADAVDLFTRRK